MAAEPHPSAGILRGREAALAMAERLRDEAPNGSVGRLMYEAADEIDHLLLVIEGYRAVIRDWAQDIADRSHSDSQAGS